MNPHPAAFRKSVPSNPAPRNLVKSQTAWYPLWLLLGLAAVMTPAILLAASGNEASFNQGHQGFDAVVRAVESRYHVRATKIPFLGLMTGIMGISAKTGVHNIHLAEFENFKTEGDLPVDGNEFYNLVEDRVQDRAGSGWSRMIRETSHTGASQTLIYVRPEGKQVGMLIVDLDGHDLDIVQISMNPDQLMNQVREHDHHDPHLSTPNPNPNPDNDPHNKPDNDSGNDSGNHPTTTNQASQ